MTEASPLLFPALRIAVTVVGLAASAGLWLWWNQRRRTIPRRLQVQDRLVVGRGVSLLLLEVERQRMLIGVSSEGVRLVRNLGSTDNPTDGTVIAPLAASAASTSRPVRFSELLGRAAEALRR